MNIYRRDEFDSRAYEWNRDGRRLAALSLAAHFVILVAMCATSFLLAIRWWAWPNRLTVGGTFLVLFALLMAFVGLLASAVGAVRNRARRLPPSARHDWALYTYHHLDDTWLDRDGELLLLMARMDIVLGERLRAEDALSEIRMGKLSIDEVKLYDLLWAAAKSLPRVDGERESAQQNGTPWNWYVRYKGIAPDGATRIAFPGDDEIMQWLRFRRGRGRDDRGGRGRRQGAAIARKAEDADSAALVPAAQGVAHGAAQHAAQDAGQDAGQGDGRARERAQKARIELLQATVAAAEDPHRRHPLGVLLYSLMAAHCVFFLGVWLGPANDWLVRPGYLLAAGIAAVACLVAVSVWTAWYMRDRRDSEDRRIGRETTGLRRSANLMADIGMCATVMLFILYGVFMVTYDSSLYQEARSERVVARGVLLEGPDGRPAAYDIVTVLSPDAPGDAVGCYRAPDFIFMEKCTDPKALALLGR